MYISLCSTMPCQITASPLSASYFAPFRDLTREGIEPNPGWRCRHCGKWYKCVKPKNGPTFKTPGFDSPTCINCGAPRSETSLKRGAARARAAANPPPKIDPTTVPTTRIPTTNRRMYNLQRKMIKSGELKPNFSRRDFGGTSRKMGTKKTIAENKRRQLAHCKRLRDQLKEQLSARRPGGEGRCEAEGCTVPISNCDIHHNHTDLKGKPPAKPLFSPETKLPLKVSAKKLKEHGGNFSRMTTPGHIKIEIANNTVDKKIELQVLCPSHHMDLHYRLNPDKVRGRTENSRRAYATVNQYKRDKKTCQHKDCLMRDLICTKGNEHMFDLDHIIDKKSQVKVKGMEKIDSVSQMAQRGASDKVLLEEMGKCRLLHRTCHIQHTIAQRKDKNAWVLANWDALVKEFPLLQQLVDEDEVQEEDMVEAEAHPEEADEIEEEEEEAENQEESDDEVQILNSPPPTAATSTPNTRRVRPRTRSPASTTAVRSFSGLQTNLTTVTLDIDMEDDFLESPTPPPTRATPAAASSSSSSSTTRLRPRPQPTTLSSTIYEGQMTVLWNPVLRQTTPVTSEIAANPSSWVCRGCGLWNYAESLICPNCSGKRKDGWRRGDGPSADKKDDFGQGGSGGGIGGSGQGIMVY